MAQEVDRGESFQGKKELKQVTDIILKQNHIVIGTESKPFKGIYNGQGKTIDKLYINNTQNNQGLFGYVDNATITGVIIGQNSEITAGGFVGGIVGYGINQSKILNCGNNGTVKATIGNCVGGIIGRGDETIEITSTYNKGKVTSESRS